jgi:YVTN family beta-propeller protein
MNVRKTAIAAALAALAGSALAAPTPFATLAVGDNAGGIAFDPVLRYAFVTNYADGTVSEIDLDSVTVSATIPAGDNPRRVVSDAALHRLYLVNDTTPGTVTVIDTSVNGMLARIGVGDRPRNIAADFTKGEVYVTNRDSGTLSVIDVATNTVVATVRAGTNPGGIDVDSRRNRIYVPSGPDGTLSVIDQNTHELLQTIAVGRNPGAATADERSGKVYVNNVDDNTISVLDSTGALVAVLPSGAGSTFGTVSGVYHRYYLPNANDGTLTIVDTELDAVSNTLAVGASPQQAIVDAAAGKVYVANRDGDNVAVIDAASETPLGAFDAGVKPSRIAASMGRLFVLNDNAGGADAVTIAAEPTTANDTAIVTEFYSKVFGRYFNTADGIETRLLGDGVFGDDWHRTMEFWRAWKYGTPDRVPMCRLVSFDGGNVSHLYTTDASQCAELKANGGWRYEGTSYYVATPDTAGSCRDGTEPLFRLFNQSPDAPDYRYTADIVVRDAMALDGWRIEGAGNGGAFACVPTLREAQRFAPAAVAPTVLAPRTPIVQQAQTRRPEMPLRDAELIMPGHHPGPVKPPSRFAMEP